MTDVAINPMWLWSAASYQRMRRTLTSRDEPVALLLSQADAHVHLRAIREAMRPRYRAEYGIDGVSYPLPLDAVGLFEGSPVYVVPWLKAGQFAWAWPGEE